MSTRRLSAPLVALVGASLAAAPGRAQETQPPETSQRPPFAEETEKRPSADPPFFKLLFKDMGHVLASPAHWTGGEWAVAFVTLGGAAALSTVDDETYAWAKRQGNAWQDLADSGEWFGDVRVLGVLGAFYAGGAAFHDDKAKRVCIDGLIAAGIADGLITSVVATGVGRERPNKDHGAYSFRPLRGRSFPSGHVTTMFAVASVIGASYDSPVVKVVVYGLALAGSYARLRKGAHFLSDELVGGVIGQSVGNTIVHYNRGVREGYAEEERGRRRVAVMPFVPDGGGFGVTISLAP